MLLNRGTSRFHFHYLLPQGALTIRNVGTGDLKTATISTTQLYLPARADSPVEFRSQTFVLLYQAFDNLEGLRR